MNKLLIIFISFVLIVTGSATLYAMEAQQELPTETKKAYRYYGSELCAYPEFRCIKVTRGDTWEKLFPNERERELVKRLNRTNVPLQYRRWIVIPTNLNKLSYMDLSPFPGHVQTEERFVVVNLSLHAFGAYDDKGDLVYWGPVSAAKGWCPDVKMYCNTAVGAFRIVEKEGPKCISKTFPIETNGGAPMPYCMNYYRGFALHGSTLPGFHASHGCIRLFPQDAEWLNKHFVKVGTRVVVTPE